MDLGRFAILKNQARAEADLAGYLKDMKIHKLAKDTEGEWHGSGAEKLLKEDVRNDLHKKKKPKDLRETRDEYKEFKLKVFRGHIYQEDRNKKESLYWNVKKEKKKKKKQAKREGRKYIDEDNDFHDPVLEFVTLDTWS